MPGQNLDGDIKGTGKDDAKDIAKYRTRILYRDERIYHFGRGRRMPGLINIPKEPPRTNGPISHRRTFSRVSFWS